MIKIYHKECDDRFHRSDVSMNSCCKFEVVALVNTDSFENAYHRTQHLDGAWWSNYDALRLTSHDHVRSTSVGDILQNTLTGECKIVDSVGFKDAGVMQMNDWVVRTEGVL